MDAASTVPGYPGLPLNTENDIRLIEIQPGDLADGICCKIVNVKLHDAPKYEALSYTWGSENDKHSIQCEESTAKQTGHLLITANCVAALRRLRRKESPRTVWIDAICINQTDVNERNHQLGLMAKIYTQAEQVVIHLGERSDNSDSAMDWIRQIDDPNFDCRPRLYYEGGDTRVLRPETKMLESLLSRPWFNRIWVLQEALLSKSAVVYCGEKFASWDAIKQFKEFNENAKWVEHVPHVISRRLPAFIESVTVEYQVLMELQNSRTCEATNPRDKVYALMPLLSHFGINMELKPDYSHSTTRIFTDVASYLINSIGLELLCAVRGNSQLPDLPSWVPDWSIGIRRSLLGLNNAELHRALQSHGCGGTFETPWRPADPTQLPFAISRIDQQDVFSAHLSTKAFRLGKISRIGDPCGDDEDFPPLRQWKAVVFEAGLADALVTKVCRNDQIRGLKGNAFEYTVVAGEVVYSEVLKGAMKIFMKDEDEGTSRITIREWLKHLAGSHRTQAEMMLNACRGRRLLVTDTGYMGLAPLEANAGDVVYIIPRVSVPFVFKEEESGLKLVGECYVQNVMEGEAMTGLDESQLENITII